MVRSGALRYGWVRQVEAVLSGSVQSGRVESSRVKLRQSCRVWMWCVALSHAEPRQSGRVESCRIVFGYVKAVLLGLDERTTCAE